MLKVELENNGIVFKTSCDTEVLLYAYWIWGTKMLGKLDGILPFQYTMTEKNFSTSQRSLRSKTSVLQIDSESFTSLLL